MSRFAVLFSTVCLSALSGQCLAADDAQPPQGDLLPSELSEAEQAFVEQLQDKVLVGRFSMDGRGIGEPKEERYAISSVTKLRGDDWLVNARITYGKNDVDVPVPVKVHWAGDTPVLSVTDLAIPLLGEGFTARVMFYRDRYAGSWYHGKAGGHMWGRIDSSPPQAKSDQQLQKQLQSPTKVDFEEARLSAVVKYLSEAHDIPIVLADGVDGQVLITAAIDGMTLQAALEEMLAPHRLEAVVDRGALRIRRAGPAKETTN